MWTKVQTVAFVDGVRGRSSHTVVPFEIPADVTKRFGTTLVPHSISKVESSNSDATQPEILACGESWRGIELLQRKALGFYHIR